MSFLRKIFYGLAAASALVACATDNSSDQAQTPVIEAQSQAARAPSVTLTVALYPYVPRLDQFQTAIQSAWTAAHPNVTLNFVPAANWDGGYSMDPDPSFDVFVFDGMFFEYFRQQGYLAGITPGQIDNEADFLDYAKTGVQYGGNYYAIPLLGCANILFYEKTNAALAAAKTLTDVATALGQYTYTSQEPPDRRGLMIDMAGGSTNAALYLDTAHSLNGIYPLPLPASPSALNPQAVANMTKLISLASYWNATRSTPAPYEQATWFSDGYGKAVVGYTESMSAMSAATRSNIAFKVMPLSDKTGYPELFYADVIGVNAKSSQQALAIELANMIASTPVFVAATGPTTSPGGQGLSPQYLMATRKSAFAALAKIDPLYNDMYGLITTNTPLMFKLDSAARSWLSNMKDAIRSAPRMNYQGGCDYPAASIIASSSQAVSLCTAACSAHGGWNSQWTNQNPAAAGGSACGCNSCPVPN